LVWLDYALFGGGGQGLIQYPPIVLSAESKPYWYKIKTVLTLLWSLYFILSIQCSVVPYSKSLGKEVDYSLNTQTWCKIIYMDRSRIPFSWCVQKAETWRCSGQWRRWTTQKSRRTYLACWTRETLCGWPCLNHRLCIRW